MKIRSVKSTDYYTISPLINDWWGGRNMVDMLPKLFFDHFQQTSFVVEENEVVVGFLIGFLSQSNADEAYIHFVGVHPNWRKHRIGSKLYEHFFQVIQNEGRHIVRCITSPVNKTSIAYHTKLGFEVEEGNMNIDGVSVHQNYDGEGKERVLFVKNLKA
ncbi:GNAT family N-acetyltransferase [Priestia koreensis]|uniref:GNAT family N-acetyltransferase n=1 Tax=Priestia koreensis TaxID=284581 RepID=UPI001F570C22|nr:GNAT family N-acetyltransferase [Priestia koreensis]UNL83371.1 GNAT family N-acetyltransferase [Priestia koreensis]